MQAQRISSHLANGLTPLDAALRTPALRGKGKSETRYNFFSEFRVRPYSETGFDTDTDTISAKTALLVKVMKALTVVGIRAGCSLALMLLVLIM